MRRLKQVRGAWACEKQHQKDFWVLAGMAAAFFMYYVGLLWYDAIPGPSEKLEADNYDQHGALR